MSSRASAWTFYAVLLGAAFAVAFAARTHDRVDSPTPSVENHGSRGIRAAFLYLQEKGYSTHVLERPLTEIPEDVATIVVAAPVGSNVSEDEVASLQVFVRRGGTLVLMGRELSKTQPALARWLQSKDGGRVGRDGDRPDDDADPEGTSVAVWLREGPFTHTDHLRVADASGVSVGHPSALPVAGTSRAAAVWWVREGSGEVLVFAGPDALENRRIELEDNLVVWDALARRGPIAFDERHHRLPPPPPMSRGIWALVLQLAAVFAFFAVARGTRLGPPRPDVAVRHRSRMEYLNAFAWLTRRAGVERALLEELHARFRLLIQERVGVGTSLDDAEVARELERHCRIPQSVYLDAIRLLQTLRAQRRIRPRQYANAVERFAQLERVVTGRDEAMRLG